MMGAEIIASVAAEYGVPAAELRGKRKTTPLPSARREASCRMRDAGYSIGRIAMILGVSEVTVCEHIYPHYRAKAIARRAASRRAP